MSYTRVICMECAADYMQKTDPTGNIYQVNVYMCGVVVLEKSIRKN